MVLAQKKYTDTYTGVKSPFVISDLEPGSSHYFVILSSGKVNNTTVTVTSSEFTFTIPIDKDIEKPGPFTMSAVPGDGQVVVSWEKADRAVYYVIQKGTSTGLYTKLVKSLAESPYIDKDLTNGKKLYYIVIALNSKGSANATNEAVVTPTAAPPLPPPPITFGLVTATPGDRSVALSWASLTGASSYQIKRADSQAGPFTLMGTSSSTEYEDTGLTGGSTYYYIISGLDANAASLANSATVDAIPLTLPGTFTITPTIGSFHIQLSWTVSADATSYTVEYGTSSGSYPHIVSSNATSPINVTGLANGTPYYFKVIATNSSGSISPSELVLTPTANPGAFTLTGTIGNQQIQLDWTSSVGAVSCDLKYGTSSGVYSTTINDATSPTTITGLTNGTTYYFKVTAINPAGVSNSNQVATVPGPPGAFSITSATAGNAQVTLQWSTSSRATSYTVDYGTTSLVYDLSVSSLVGIQTTITNLVNDTPYFFRVTAYNGGGSISTAEVSATPIPWHGIKYFNLDWVWSNAVDANQNLFLAGFTGLALQGQTLHALNDYYIAKIDKTGTLTWVTQMGSISSPTVSTHATGISLDSLGNMYIVGDTQGPLADQSQYGNSDYFIAKYNSARTLLWTRQLGSAGTYIEAGGIVLDSTGNIYISGHITFGAFPGQTQTGVRDYFLVQYDTDGNRNWIQQYGAVGVGAQSDTVIGRTLFVDSSDNIYITGTTNGTFSGQTLSGMRDFFIAQYDSSGNRNWLTQYGEIGKGVFYETNVVMVGTNVFVSGTESTTFNGGQPSLPGVPNFDIFLAKFDSAGVFQSKYKYDTGTSWTECTAMTKDSLGNIYTAGFTAGSVDGQTQVGLDDFFMMKFDSNGNKIFTRQNGFTNIHSYPRTITSDALNNLYISGANALGTFTAKYDSAGNLK